MMITFMILSIILLGVMAVCLGLTLETKDPFGIVLLGLLGCVSFFFVQYFPLSSKDSYLPDFSKYFQITSYENGFLVTNLENLSTSREFDIRFIQAYKEERLYVKQTENFNIFGKSTGSYYTLSFNP